MLAYRFIAGLIVFSFFIAPATPILAETQQTTAAADDRWIINDGGVSYLPAGSLSGLALALERGAASVRVDLVLSSDNQVMLLSDTRIDRITDVAERYPERSRPDGSYYAFDFNLDELRRLSLLQKTRQPAASAVSSASDMHVPVAALSDFLGYLDLRYRSSEQKPIVICTLRQGWMHNDEGKNLGSSVLELLDSHRADSGSARFYVASLDPEELQKLAEARTSAGQTGIEFMQMIGGSDGSEARRLEFGSRQPYSYDLLFTRVGIKLVSTYASAVGLYGPAIVDGSGTVIRPRLLEDIKTLGMKVIYSRADTEPYRTDDSAGDDDFYEQIFFSAGFDGMLTRADAAVRQWLENRAGAAADEQQQMIERLIDQLGESGIQPPGPVQSGATR